MSDTKAEGRVTPTRLAQARGALRLLRDGIDGTTTLVEDVHRAIARRPFEVLAWVPVAAEGASVVKPVYDAVRGAVFESVRQVNRAVCAGLDEALGAIETIERERAARASDEGAAGAPVVEAATSPGAS